MRVVRAGSDLTEAAAEILSGTLSDRLDANGHASLAVSGGNTPGPILSAISRTGLDWQHLDLYQVDERVAPAGDPSRNLTGLATALLDHVPAVVHPMPVAAPDLEAAAHEYSQELPEILDVVHLGLGDDGHTASLVPGDPVLDVDDRAVAITEPYRGYRRMTLTYPALERAAAIVWIVAGTDKASMVERLLAADPTIPAGRVPQDRAILVTNSI
jgi:6-phosphogluconolactonase